jgi:PAS domain S-box-containing protein
VNAQQTRTDFLLSLEDAIRPLVDASDITHTAARFLGQHMGVNRCAYADVEDDQDTFNLTGNFNAGVASIVGRYTFAQFGSECLRLMRANLPYVVEDSELDPRTHEVLDSYRLTAIRAVICVPLHKAGRFVAAMAVHQNQPRHWQDGEVELVQQVASRCWESIERARVTRELQVLNEKLARQVQYRTDALSRSEQQLAQLVNGILDCGIYMLDPSGRIISWNPGAQRIKGYTANEIIGENFASFYIDDDRAAGLPERALRIARDTGKFEGEGWRVRKDGSRFWASVLIDPIYASDGTLSGFAKITRDMSERRAMQERLNQSQKMEAIGQLTGGVAHDFNNLLTVILGNLDTIMRHTPAEAQKIRRAAEQATRGAERAAALTHQLLAFSRQQPLMPKSINVNHLITGMLELIRRTLPENVSVASLLGTKLGHVNVDPNQLESAILNLVVNARDAMTNGGTLTVETQQRVIDELYAQRVGDLAAGRYTVIGITDTGSGMSKEVMTRAFDPFFTTKPQGEGTGLGLSQVFGFVKQSGGHVKLYSELDRGTAVRIYLPQLEGEVDPQHAKAEDDMPRARAHEMVLVVEDEADVLSYSTESLRELGFNVLHARNADAALHIIAARSDIHLLFTDVGLPGMNGRELAEQARTVRPTLRVLFTTGYARDTVFQQGQLEANAELLTKPFNQAQLAQRVRQVLDAPSG